MYVFAIGTYTHIYIYVYIYIKTYIGILYIYICIFTYVCLFNQDPEHSASRHCMVWSSLLQLDMAVA